MNVLRTLAVVAVLTLSAPIALLAQGVPLAISYQAILTDDSGDPLSPSTPTNYPIEFRIYDAVEDGTLLWSESQAVSVFQGSFSTLLGTGDEITGEPYPQLDTIFDDSLRYLEVTIDDGGTEKTFTPRQRMVSTPFAFRARVAEEALTIVDDAVSTNQLANDAVTADKMADNSVTAAAIQTNAVGASELAANSVGESELAAGAVNLQELADAVAARLVPAGTVVAWAGGEIPRNGIGGIPDGWLLCDGRAVSIADYPELWTAIGPVYGFPGGGTFNVPDYRGYFLRGQAVNTNQDPDVNSRANASIYSPSYGGKVGSKQDDQFESHNHNNGNYDRLMILESRLGHSHTYPGGGDYSAGEPDLVETGAIVARGGTETRPKNISVWYIIKAH